MSRTAVRSFGFILFSAFFPVIAFTIFSTPAHAQAAVYGMFSAGHYSGQGVGYGTPPNQSGGITARGGTFGVYDNFIPFGPIKFGGDARFFIQNSANSTTYGNKISGFLFGPRLQIATPIPIKPYIQLQIGAVGTNNGTSSSRSTSFAYQVNGGIDYTLIPHLDLRGEYGAGQLTSIGSQNHTLQEYGIGLVLRM